MTETHRPDRRGLRVAALIGVLGTVLAAAAVAALVGFGHPSAAGRVPAKPVPSRKAAEAAESPQPIAVEPAGKIAFASQAGGGLFHIHVINADGSGDTTLTSGPGEDRDPAWSPDRTRIAFVRHAKADAPDEDADIYVINADGTGAARFTHGSGSKGDPAWAPDGTRMAFFATDRSTGRKRIFVQKLDRARRVDVSDPPQSCNDREPTWSPDSLRLVFVRKCGEEASALYLMGADGKGLLLLTDFGRTPDWSPDGGKIVYTGLGTQGPSVYVINVDGTGKTELTDSGLSGDPEWSPSGAKIVFAGSDLATVDLFIMNADGSGLSKLTNNPSDDVTASW